MIIIIRVGRQTPARGRLLPKPQPLLLGVVIRQPALDGSVEFLLLRLSTGPGASLLWTKRMGSLPLWETACGICTQVQPITVPFGPKVAKRAGTSVLWTHGPVVLPLPVPDQRPTMARL
jgi:hypothetical protein